MDESNPEEGPIMSAIDPRPEAEEIHPVFVEEMDQGSRSKLSSYVVGGIITVVGLIFTFGGLIIGLTDDIRFGLGGIVFGLLIVIIGVSILGHKSP